MPEIKSLRDGLRQLLPEMKITENQMLSEQTTFRIGGPAALTVWPETEDMLRVVLREAKAAGLRPLVLGAGSNVLAPDEGIDTVVIRLAGTFRDITFPGENRIAAGGAVLLSRLAAAACERGLSGLSFAHGIPGTVGGGSVMNAGAYGGELSRVQEKTVTMDFDGVTEVWEGDAQGFGYRTSAFADGTRIVLRAEYVLQPGARREIEAEMAELMARRKEKQPLEYPSAGSVFKRPEGAFAGALIEQAGLKGLRVGGAEVSEKHAGFIINRGGATAADVKALIERIQSAVWTNSGIRLEPELRFLSR